MDAEFRSLILQTVAKVSLLEQLVRVNLRELALANGKTPEDVLQWAEEQKVFFEQRMPPGTEAHMTAAIDGFFNVLPNDLRKILDSDSSSS
jgi:hypothetical protein